MLAAVLTGAFRSLFSSVESFAVRYLSVGVLLFLFQVLAYSTGFAAGLGVSRIGMIASAAARAIVPSLAWALLLPFVMFGVPELAAEYKRRRA